MPFLVGFISGVLGVAMALRTGRLHTLSLTSNFLFSVGLIGLVIRSRARVGC